MSALPVLNDIPALTDDVQQFLAALHERGFRGDIATDFATRLVNATDNSVYQVLPQAVLAPRDADDVQRIFRLAAEPAFHGVRFAPRGGGTGTNGQSLTSGVVVDVSRYMNRILEINIQEGWARVQPGVILDQLQDAVNPLGFFFAPELSPSNRATLGGMANTDACGKGSRLYGRTGDHVLELSLVLNDGTTLITQRIDAATLAQKQAQGDREAAIYREAVEACRDVPAHPGMERLGRFITAYNLWRAFDAEQTSFSLNALLCGAEGSLALVTALKLKLTPLPKQKALFAVRYKSFDAALEAAQTLLAHQPSAVETIDDKILMLARDDIIFPKVKPYLGEDSDFSGNAINLVEFVGEQVEEFAARVEALKAELAVAPGVIGFHYSTEKSAQAALWDLRKKGVGLLGNAKGKRRPIPFVEDTAVPPENLAAYIREFRALLDGHGLSYGMFGHVDVGCLHVRPALNLRDGVDEDLFRKISDGVYALVAKYGGVMWSEHGKGFRSAYGREFHGDLIWQRMRRVKTAFDPRNQLNPGKICPPLDCDEALVDPFTSTRGERDRQIPLQMEEQAPGAVYCNGNGQCFDYRMDSVMCPSYKASGDRVHSPKGRSGLMREWLRQAAQANVDLSVREDHEGLTEKLNRQLRRFGQRADHDFSHQVKAAMDGCLSCKACSTQCPIKVDVPTQRALFLHHYHRRYPRRLRDMLTATLESWAPKAALLPGLANLLMNNPLSAVLAEKLLGARAFPHFSYRNLHTLLRRQPALRFDAKLLEQMDAGDRARTVVILPDVFTAFFDGGVLHDTVTLLQRLGRKVLVMPALPIGKPLHVSGRLPAFWRVARTTAATLAPLRDAGVSVVGLENTQVLALRQEYAGVPDLPPLPDVLMLQEYLATLDVVPKVKSAAPLMLFQHCTEKTQSPASTAQWQQVMQRFGIAVQLPATGCCGMAGNYGHEAEHAATSRTLWEQSWAAPLAARTPGQQACASGFSCREQAQIQSGKRLAHPVELLLAALVD